MIQILTSSTDGTIVKDLKDHEEVVEYLKTLQNGHSNIVTVASTKSWESISGTKTVLLRALNKTDIFNLLGA